MITVIRTGLLLALVGLVVMDPRAMVVTKFFLNQYAFAESSFKLILLLLFLTVLSAIQPLGSIWKESWNRRFSALLILLYGFTLTEYLYYCWLFQLSPTRRTVVFDGGTFSTTRIDHIHNAKAVLSVFLPYRGQAFDAGTPFLSIYPRSVLVVHGVLFLLVCLATVLLVHHYARQWTAERTLFLALAMFPLVEEVVDGGPLQLDNSTRLILVALVLTRGVYRNILLVCGFSLFFANLYLGAHKGLLFNLVTGCVGVVGLMLPLAFERMRLERSVLAGVGFVVLLTLFLGTPLWKYHHYSHFQKTNYSPGAWLYGNSKLEKGWTVHIVSGGELPKQDIGELMGTSRANRLRISHLKLNRETTPFELCRLLRLNVLRGPVTWYQEPVYAIIEGPFVLQEPAKSLDSECVQRYSLTTTRGQSRLVLELIPGSQIPVAADLMQNGPYVADKFDWTYTEPEVTSWIPR